MKPNAGRRTFLATCAMAGAAAARPLAAFGQAVENARQASSPSALRITDVKCGYVRGSLFVKIHTNQGIWGCGEAVDAIQGTYQMVQSFGQRLRNQSPLQRASAVRADSEGRRVRRRPVRRLHRGAVGRGNGAVGSGRQGAERAGVPAARREVPRSHPRLRATPRCIRRGCRTPELFAAGGDRRPPRPATPP